MMQTFDDIEQTKILRRLHEIAVEDTARIFIVHDLNPRALSPRVIGFVQARSWYQDLTPIVVTSPPN
jgi:peptide/nickel transport system substrate-binding protein